MKDFEPKGSESTFGSNLNKENTPVVPPPSVITEPPPNTNTAGGNELISSLQSDYHLTVQLKIKLDRRQVSLLLGILCYQCTHSGVTFPMYLQLLHLNEILIGNKIRASEIKNKFERLSVELSQVIIRDLAGKSLTFNEPILVSKKTKELLLRSKALMTRDVYKSRFTCWRPEWFLTLKTVPVDVIIERSGNSVRYTSYCKGYGEGSGRTRKGRTPECFELDGEEPQEWILSEQLSAKELAQEAFLLAHFEWLKRFEGET